jgi:flagellar basal body-associated protein FliL
MRQKRKSSGALKIVLVVLAAILVFVGLGFVGWTRFVRYPAFPEAAAPTKNAKVNLG